VGQENKGTKMSYDSWKLSNREDEQDAASAVERRRQYLEDTADERMERYLDEAEERRRSEQ